MSIRVFTVYQCGHGESGYHIQQAKGHKILQGSNKYSLLAIKKIMYFLCFVKGEYFFLPTRKLHYSDLAVTACLPPPPPSQFEILLRTK